MSKATNKTKKAPAKTKPKESNDDYYTKEEEERLDKFHAETGNKFTDEEIYALMVKYKNDDQAVSNELKELLKDAKRGAEYEWQEVGKDGKVKEKPKPPEKKKKKNNYNNNYNYSYGYNSYGYNNYSNSNYDDGYNYSSGYNYSKRGRGRGRGRGRRYNNEARTEAKEIDDIEFIPYKKEEEQEKKPEAVEDKKEDIKEEEKKSHPSKKR